VGNTLRFFPIARAFKHLRDNSHVTGVSLLLARHGQTADNASGLILGRRDPALSELGEQQAAGLAIQARARGVVAIWCSPLLRARQTAAVVGHGTGVEPAVVTDLIESDRGDWEGVSQTVLAQRTPELFAAFEAGDPDFVFPGGESLHSQVLRTRTALAMVAAGPQPSLVVAHAGTIRAALIATGRPVPPERALVNGQAVALDWSSPDDQADGCRRT
jgi:probable phosphoglycerate mutase